MLDWTFKKIGKGPSLCQCIYSQTLSRHNKHRHTHTHTVSIHIHAQKQTKCKMFLIEFNALLFQIYNSIRVVLLNMQQTENKRLHERVWLATI